MEEKDRELLIEVLTIGDQLMYLYNERRRLKLELHYTNTMIERHEKRIQEIQDSVQKKEA